MHRSDPSQREAERPAAAAGSRGRHGLGRRILIAVAAPIVFLAVVELGLRLGLDSRRLALDFYEAASGVATHRLHPDTAGTYWMSGRFCTVRIDPAGRRVVRGGPVAPDARTVHVVGDSIVFGWGLDDADTPPSRLQARLGPGFRVVGHGVPGYGPVQYARLVEPLPREELVVVVYCEANDAHDALAPDDLVVVDGYLVTRTAAERVPSWLMDLRLAHGFAHLRDRLFGDGARDPDTAAPARVPDATAPERLAALHARIRAGRGANLIAVSAPTATQVATDTETPATDFGRFDALAMRTAFRRLARSTTVHLEDGVHLSRSAADLLAGRIREEILRRTEGGP